MRNKCSAKYGKPRTGWKSASRTLRRFCLSGNEPETPAEADRMRTFIVIVILLLLLVAAGVASVLSFHFSSPRDIRVGETVSETPLEFRNGHLVPVPNHDGSNVQVRPSGVVVENIPQRSHVRMGFTFFPLLGIGVVFCSAPIASCLGIFARQKPASRFRRKRIAPSDLGGTETGWKNGLRTWKRFCLNGTNRCEEEFGLCWACLKFF